MNEECRQKQINKYMRPRSKHMCKHKHMGNINLIIYKQENFQNFKL